MYVVIDGVKLTEDQVKEASRKLEEAKARWVPSVGEFFTIGHGIKSSVKYLALSEKASQCQAERFGYSNPEEWIASVMLNSSVGTRGYIDMFKKDGTDFRFITLQFKEV